MKKWIFSIVIAGMLGYAIYSFVSADRVPVEGVEVGDIAPDFELETIEGETVSLADLSGQKVFLNFWASWCGPCRAEMPDMQKFHEERDDVTILGVNVNDRPENMHEFLEEYGITFPILPDDVDTNVHTQYKVQAMPTSYLIDSNGEIAHVAVGELTYEEMVHHFDEMN